MEPKVFGAELRKIRKEKGLTLQELGEKAGFTKSYLSIIENGRQGLPQPETLKRLADGLGVEYELLMYKAGYVDKRFYSKANEVRQGMEILKGVIEKGETLDGTGRKLSKEDVEKFFPIFESTEKILAFETEIASYGLLKKLEFHHYYKRRKQILDDELKASNENGNDTEKIQTELMVIEDLKETLNEHDYINLEDPIDFKELLGRSIDVTYNGRILTAKEKAKILHITDILLDEGE